MVARKAPKDKRDPYAQVFVDGKKNRAHVMVAEKALGKKLPKGAEIHHVDENKLNNDPSNLVICPSRAYHFLLHRRQRALDGCGNADYLWCSFCKKFDAPENLIVRTMSPNRLHVIHRACKNKQQNELRWRKQKHG